LIYFRTIRWKNFLSTGNAFTEVSLDRSPSTLVLCENGSGKSTILDALTYALFNKPFRNISKPQLINSINGKKLLVEVEFDIGKKHYLVRRGASPNVFQIELDGEVINQDANVRDYQKHLEENVLKLNYKSFTQISVLGSASFTPFMQLHLGARREIIEDILDIQIFTTMNKVLKDKVNALKDKIRVLQNEVDLAKERATMQKKYIETLEADKANKIEKIKEEINELEQTIKENENLATKTIEKKDSMGDVETKRKKLVEYRKGIERRIRESRSELEFYHDNEDCPTCKQGIPHEFKERITTEKTDSVDKLEQALNELDEAYKEVDEAYEKYLELNEEVMRINNDIITEQRVLQRLYLEINDTENKVADIDAEKTTLKALAKNVISKNLERSVLSEENTYFDVASALLKDSGIKTKIIRQYLPVINKLVNKYLAAMDFFVQFDLDETFKETIKSRHRDKFSYASFSEGEKQRIDLALIFTWRTIAKMKNSASTNLLLLDEVFDSSLDNNGTDYVMTLLNTIGNDTNVFVISHKGDQLFDKFRSVIRFEKKQNYSVMV
jgi:DNA repair exonuclease SbcCD ATPase subunit